MLKGYSTNMAHYSVVQVFGSSVTIIEVGGKKYNTFSDSRGGCVWFNKLPPVMSLWLNCIVGDIEWCSNES